MRAFVDTQQYLSCALQNW